MQQGMKSRPRLYTDWRRPSRERRRRLAILIAAAAAAAFSIWLLGGAGASWPGHW